MSKINMRFSAQIVTLAASVFLLQGCTDGWFNKRTNPKSEPAVMTEKAKPAAKTYAKPAANPKKVLKVSAKPTQKPSTATRNVETGGNKSMTAATTLDLNVFYLQRILVPAGSKLTLSLTGKGISKPVVQTSLSKGGPPYKLQMQVPKGAEYPLTVDVLLESSIGHKFSGRGVVQKKPSSSFEIIISPS